MPTLDLHQLFTQHFGRAENAVTVRAPGRVNLIGEHIDYNDGFVLPMALPLQTMLRFAPRADRTVELYSANLDQRLSFSLNDLTPQNNWIDYVQGVAVELAGASVPLHGFGGVISSDVPAASGLSSSAALEVAAALAFTHLAQQPMSPVDLAKLCQRAENKFVGVNSGIMDQMAVAACHADHALLIDCRSLELEQIPLRLTDHCIVVTDSGAPRELASSAYNQRRAECDQGLALLQNHLPGVASLRDIMSKDLERFGRRLPEIILDRVEHVVLETQRTLLACDCLKSGDLEQFGEYMNESHVSLSALYEVSSPELDWLADWAIEQPGVLGSRMTGAGFGGCTVTLIEKQHAADFMSRLPAAYKQAMSRDARCWDCTAAQGAKVLSP